MNAFDGNNIGMTTCWASPSSPSPRTLLAMLNQADNNGHVVDQISEIFPQTNHQSEQRSGLRERVAARIEFNLPPLEIQNNRPFAALFRNPSPTVPSPLLLISPGFSPSAMLQFPNRFFDPTHRILPSPVANGGPPEAVESSGADHAMMKVSNNDPMHVALPPQQDASFESGPAVNETDVINMEIERENKDDEEYMEDDHNIVDELDAEPSSPKRSKFGGATMIGATRSCKSQRVIIQVETEENNPDDGFRWRKYGQKVVKGNPNARSYYKCTYSACNVKKHVERGAEDVKFLLITYDGIHEHDPPAARGSSSSGLKSRYGSSVSQDYNNHQTVRLGRPPSSSQAMRLFPSSLDPPMDMTQFYMTGLAKLPSLPVNQNHGLMNRNEEPKIDRVIPDGTEVFKGIRDRLNLNFGLSL
ncbi:probable WRKY transcription factor 10 [Raphanus sativus]|uniref:Probable WRKY transcription factor 10 n=1 Tax=Raphanus sativus TaxID=3726 RepID=A0A6J0JSG9_RAPSA|nr:probable WRKY transcription factor 10 [Raphanus sativus]